MLSLMMAAAFENEIRKDQEKWRDQLMVRDPRGLGSLEKQEHKPLFPQIDPDMAPEGTHGDWRP